PLAVARDVQVAVDVAAHAVEAVVVELLDEAFAGQAAVGADGERPDVALHRLVDVQRLAIGTDLDAVGRAHVAGGERNLAVSVDLPHLSGTLAPVRIAGVERSVGCDGEVVGLVHAVVVGEDGDFSGLRFDLQDVVADVVGDIHDAPAIEDDAVADTLARQGDPHLGLAVGRDLADGLLTGEVHGVDVALPVAVRPLHAGGQTVLLP